jgi:hypothetical protein
MLRPIGQRPHRRGIYARSQGSMEVQDFVACEVT